MKKVWKPAIDGRNKSASEIIEEVWKRRKISNPDAFLHPSVDCLIPYEKMVNIDIAASRVLDAINKGENILVYFDTDTDGCTSGAIATRYLRNYTTNIRTYINHGKKHGIQDFSFDFLKDIGLLIIVDAIETDSAVYEEILSRGVKLTVWDHHDLKPEIEDMAEAIGLVSSANDYPNPELTGAGVTWKVCKYIDSITNNHYADKLVDLAAVGLIADVGSVGKDSMENRYICNKGFWSLRNPAISAINGNYEFDSTSVSFGIAPLVNSANRVDQNEDAKRLFISDDNDEIGILIKRLQSYKEEQNKEILAQMGDLEEQIEPQLGNKCLFCTIDTDYGISGLIANKIMDKYDRPVIVINGAPDERTGNYTGSMRAVGVANMSALVNNTGLAECKGHPNSAGFFCKEQNLERFKQAICRSLDKIEFVKDADIDLQLSAYQVTQELIESLKEINHISGKAFKPITVLIEDVEGYEIGQMSNGKHLKISINNLLFIKWNFNAWDTLEENKSFSAIGTLDCGMLGRKFYLKMIMNDFKFEDKIDLF